MRSELCAAAPFNKWWACSYKCTRELVVIHIELRQVLIDTERLLSTCTDEELAAMGAVMILLQLVSIFTFTSTALAGN